MAKKTINIGSSENAGNGDPLRLAFSKINENFTELYTLTGGTTAELTEIAQDYAAPLLNHNSHVNITAVYQDSNNKIILTGNAAQIQTDWDAATGLGSILNKPALFSGSYTDLSNKPAIPADISDLTDTTNLLFDGDYNNLTNKPAIPDLANVAENIIPTTDIAYDIGSPTNRFRDIYLSTNTIYLGTNAVGVDANGQLVISESYQGGEGIGDIASVEWTTNSVLEIRTTDTSPFVAKFDSLKKGDTFELLTGSNGSFPSDTVVTLTGPATKTLDGSGDYYDFVIPVDIAAGTNVFVYNFDLTKSPLTDVDQLSDASGLLGGTVDRLTDSGDELILTGGANPYVTFPAVTGGNQLAIQGSEIATISGTLGLTSLTDIALSANGNNAGGIGLQVWNFGSDGIFSVPGSIKNTTSLGGEISIITASAQGDPSKSWAFSHDGQGALSVPYGSAITSENRLHVTSRAASFENFSSIVDFDSNSYLEFTYIHIVSPQASILNKINPSSPNYIGGTGAKVRIIHGDNQVYETTLTGGFASNGTDPFTGLLRYTATVPYINIAGSLIKNLGIGTSATWQFSQDGGLKLPDGTVTTGKTTTVPEDENFTVNLLHDMMQGDGPETYSFVVSYDQIRLPTRNGTIIAGPGSSDNEWSLDAVNKVLSFPNNDDILYDGDVATGGRDYGLNLFTYTKPVIITSGQTKHWTFGTNGNLTLPGELHGAPVMSVGPMPSQVGRTVDITPADDASDKKFKFRVDQYAGQLFTRAYLELPTAEVDKQVAAVFPHTNTTAGYIYTQGSDTFNDGLNDAFNIFYNAGDIKLTAMTPVTGTFNTWKFGDDGNLTFPDATVQTTAFTGNAATVDITNTNGIDTNYSITFVENRDAAQYLRGDVDLTFNSATNLLTAGNITTGILKINDGVHEKFQTKTSATGAVTHDCSSGHIFYHSSVSDNWTVNLTNLNLAAGYATAITLIIEQGVTGYYPSALQIDGNPMSIAWQGNTTPTLSTNRKDVVTFSIINNGGTYTVLGQLTGF